MKKADVINLFYNISRNLFLLYLVLYVLAANDIISLSIKYGHLLFIFLVFFLFLVIQIKYLGFENYINKVVDKFFFWSNHKQKILNSTLKFTEKSNSTFLYLALFFALLLAFLEIYYSEYLPQFFNSGNYLLHIFVFCVFLIVILIFYDKSFLESSNYWYSKYFLGIILIFGFILRVYFYDVVQNADFYNLISAKAIYDTGFTYYTRNLDYSYVIAFLFKLFGKSVFWARILPIIFNVITGYYVYKICKHFKSEIAGLIASFLIMISPWCIGVSLSIREYSFNLMITTVIFYYLLTQYKYRLFSLKGLLPYLTIPLLYVYSKVFENFTIMSSLLLFCIFLLYKIFFDICSKKYRFNFERNLLVTIGLIILFVLFNLNLFNSFFIKKLTFDQSVLNYYFHANQQFPMQWFTGPSWIPAFFLIILLISSWNNVNLRKLILIFFSYLSIFTFYTLSLNVIAPRYVSNVFFIYVIFLSFGLYNIFKILWKFRINWFLKIIMILMTVLILVNPITITQGLAFDTKPFDSQSKRLVYQSFTYSYHDLFDNLQKAGVQPDDPIVIESVYNLIIWYLDYTVDDSQPLVRYDTNRYDNGLNMYHENRNEYAQLYQLGDAIKNHRSGWILTRNDAYPYKYPRYVNRKYELVDSDIGDYVNITEIEWFSNESFGFELYRWEK